MAPGSGGPPGRPTPTQISALTLYPAWLGRKSFTVHETGATPEFAKLDLQVNEGKSRIVDLSQGESFGFLG
jgi:hypothetical protein